MKRILIFSLTYYPNFYGGAEVKVREITDRIDEERFSFDMVTLRYSSDLPRSERIGNINVYRIGPVFKNISARDLNSFPYKINKYIFPFISFIFGLYLNKKNKYDAIWSPMTGYASFGVVFFRFFARNVKYIATLDDGDPIEYLKDRVKFVYPFLGRFFSKSKILSKFFEYFSLYPLFKLVYTTPACVHVTSSYLSFLAREMGYRGDIKIIPNAVNFSHFAQEYSENDINELKNNLGKKGDDIFIITTSRLVKKNATEDTIESLKYLSNNIKFLVLGIGEDEQKLKALTKNLGLENRVFFLGQIDHKIMPLYLKVSDIFIRPSLTEGFGISFIEAMASKIPVIATKVGGIPDFLFDPSTNKKPTGLFVSVKDPKDIADKVNLLIKDTKLKNEIIENGSNLVMENYDWSLISKRMENEVFGAI